MTWECLSWYECHGSGAIDVDSRRGEGTTFTVRLPTPDETDAGQ